MSRIGNKPVAIPGGVEVRQEGRTLTVKGGKGELSLELPAAVEAEIKGNEVILTRRGEDRESRSLHGTMRSLVANMVEGVHKGYTRELEIQGVGYRAQAQGRKLTLSLGYSHTIDYEVPEGVTATVEGAFIRITGADKQAVGQVGAHIRGFAPAEPYKGKGVRYRDERVRRKAGKTVA